MSPVSALFVGPFIDVLGRKKGLLFFYINMGLGFSIIACASKVWHIYLGRCICSFAVGLEVAAVVYMSETCPKELRSIILSISSATLTIGISITYVIGGYLHWALASAIFAVGCFVYVIIQALAPETPPWLFKQGFKDDATRSLQQLGRSPSGILREIKLLEISAPEHTERLSIGTFLDPTIYKPFLIIFAFMFLQVLTGVYHIMYYTLNFVERLGTTYDSLQVSIIIALARMLANLTLGGYSTAFVSRKWATALSAGLGAIVLALAGAYEFLYRSVPVGQKPYEWVPIALVVVNIAASMIAVTPLPWLMGGEVFPLRVRGSMSGAVFVVGSAMMFFFIKIYEELMELLQIWGMLFFYAVASVVMVLFAVYLLPETQGKSLFEIEQGFLPKNKRLSREPEPAGGATS
nr:PREDICTED: facilitated trehalose transporter Tret1-like isoform X2 [Bemisia tabaci]XP_018901762.1 PREDICTED: facilitated trehalose transporter Tret1-like isoform X2 [Bemisia tabaci]